LDSSRLRTGEIVAGIAGIALFVSLFFDWFSGNGFIGDLSGWDALGGDVTGFIVALTSVSGVVLAWLAMSGQKVNIPAPRGSMTAALGSLSVLIILWRFFANPGDLKVGIFLGLIAAAAIAAGALMSLREDGWEPLVKVAGGPTKVATASAAAPAATPTRMAPVGRASSASKSSRSKPKRSSGSSAKRSSGSTAKKTAAKKTTAKRTTAKSKKSGSSRSTSKPRSKK